MSEKDSSEKSAKEIEAQKAKMREALQGILPTVTQDELNAHQQKAEEQYLADRPPHHGNP